MKTKNIFRVFLTAVFVFGTIAMNAQTKVYVYKSDGTTDEYNIADVDSISFTTPDVVLPPDHLATPVDISDMLQNTHKPFIKGDLAPFDGAAGRYYQLAGWTANDVCLENGNLDYNGYWAYLGDGAIGIIQAAGSTVQVENGKLYQTIELDPGYYRFDVNYIESQPGTKADVYIVANVGENLPDIDKVETDAAAFLSVKTPMDLNWDNMLSLKFIVYKKSAVSVGFVGSCYNNARVMFSKVELWQE